MASDHDSTRRGVMTALAALPLGAAAAANAEGGELRRQGSRTLVAYFSRSGNTRVVAGLIHRARGTDLFEIQPARPYPEDYLETVAQARMETDSGHEPPLAATITAMADYDTVFLGFPIWGETAPPVVRSFLSGHDLSGRTLIPFITHNGGYGTRQKPGCSRQPRAESAAAHRIRHGDGPGEADDGACDELAESRFFSHRDPARVKWMSERHLDV